MKRIIIREKAFYQNEIVVNDTVEEFVVEALNSFGAKTTQQHTIEEIENCKKYLGKLSAILLDKKVIDEKDILNLTDHGYMIDDDDYHIKVTEE